MTELLAKLTGKTPLEIQELTLALEKLSGHPSIDVRLSVEISRIADELVDSLDLDIEDTTAQELYRALLARFEKDEQRFARSLGALSHHNHDEIVPRLLAELEQLNGPKDAWALKRSVARSLMLANQPKSLMKHLHYRTADSMIKRESIEELFAAAPFVESSSWSDSMQKLYKKLLPTDFESRPIEIAAMHSQRWGSLPRQGSIVGYVPQLAAVVVWPSPDGKTYPLALAVLVLEAIRSARATCAWLEFHQVQPNFSKVAAEVLQGNLRVPLKVGNQPISWQSFVYHFGKQTSGTHHPSVEARLKADDLHAVEPELQLSKLDPQLRWWLSGRFTGKIVEGKIISFNMSDVAINHANKRNLDNASSAWLQSAVFDELVARYMKNSWVEDALLTQLEHEVAA